MRRVWLVLVGGGGAALAVALLWWRLSVPSADELDQARSEQVARELTARMLGSEAATLSLPEAATTGPIIVAIVGAFLILCGVIIYAGRR